MTFAIASPIPWFNSLQNILLFADENLILKRYSEKSAGIRRRGLAAKTIFSVSRIAFEPKIEMLF
jgi:hypothetical protein